MSTEVVQGLIQAEFSSPPFTQVELSVNAFHALKAAANVAVQQGDETISCLHLVYALFNLQPEARSVEQEKQFLQGIHDLLELHGVNHHKLDRGYKSSNAWGRKHQKQSRLGSVRAFTTRLRASLRIACVLSQNSAKDPGTVKTDTILTAILVEGTNAASGLLIEVSRGCLTAQVLSSQLNIDIKGVRSDFWIHTCYFTSLPLNDVTPTKEPLWWTPQLCHLSALGVSIDDMNTWVVPEHLMVGKIVEDSCMESPDVVLDRLVLRENGNSIDCFVCLVAEYGTPEDYQARFLELLGEEARTQQLELIYFPVYSTDTDVPTYSLIELIGDLEQRLRSGRRVLIHCVGGYRRTCLACIPLLSALFNLSYLDSVEAWCSLRLEGAPDSEEIRTQPLFSVIEDVVDMTKNH